jgi:hypothetical protein
MLKEKNGGNILFFSNHNDIDLPGVIGEKQILLLIYVI